MKNAPASPSGYFHPRILLACTLYSTGAVLAITALAGTHRNAAASATAGATIYVTTTAQKIGGIGTGGCSLQEAIYSSVLHNSLDGGAHGIAIDATDSDHFITTECVMGTGNGDTIVLPTGGVFNLSTYLDGDAYNPYGPTATPIIFSTMTIEGAGATLQWTGGSTNVRLFAIGPASITINQGSLSTTVSGTGNLTLKNVYVTSFTAKGGNGLCGGGGGMGAGGAIYLQYGALTVENCTFAGNHAVGGSALFSYQENGLRMDCSQALGGGGGLGGDGGVGFSGSGGGGAGGSKGNGGFGQGGGGGGGGTVFAGGDGYRETGGASGYLWGGNGGDAADNGTDGHPGQRPGGGGGGGGWSYNPSNPFAKIYGGSGNYGGGGGGAPDQGGDGGFGGGGGAAGVSGLVNGGDGGNGGFGGGGGGGASNQGTGGSGGAFGGNGSTYFTGDNGGGGGGLGGAIFSDSGTLTIRNSTFSGNVASPGNASHGTQGGYGGGATFSRNGSTTIVNSTFSGNLTPSPQQGGGIVVWSDTSAVFTLNNTIVANNGDVECYVTGNVTTNGTHNLILNNASGTQPFGACPGVVTNVEPQLQALQPPSVNGGLTPTMAIPLFSSAMGVADPGTSLPSDQHFADRPQPDKSPRNGYDIGALEVCRRFQGPSLVGGPCSETHITPPSTYSLTIQVSPSVDGTVNPVPGSYDEPVNSVVPIQATPNWGYGFRHWTGPVADVTNPSTTVTMTQAQTVTANFVFMRIISIRTSGSDIVVTSELTQGVTYHLERTPSLTSPNWQNVFTTVPGRTGPIPVTDPGAVSLGSAFYRVRVLP